MSKNKEPRPWSSYSEAEIRANKEKYCKKCVYRLAGGYGSSNTLLTCDYLAITGKRRGCSPIDCEKFKAGRQIRRKINIL